MADPVERSAAEYAALVPHPRADANKYTRGALLVAAGSGAYPGAAVMCAKAASRAGAGYVRLATPRDAVACARTHLLSIPVTGCTQSVGSFDELATDEVLQAGTKSAAFAVGPGMGVTAGTVAFLHALLDRLACPLVLDADALNALAAHPALMQSRAGCINVLTPHEGEAARLLGHAVGDRLEAARELSKRFDATVVLKGPRTLCVDTTGAAYVCTNAGPELAKAGMGDVLTGIIGALLAQGLAPLDATSLAVYLHALAGSRAASYVSDVAVVPEDLIENLGPAIIQLGSERQ